MIQGKHFWVGDQYFTRAFHKYSIELSFLLPQACSHISHTPIFMVPSGDGKKLKVVIKCDMVAVMGDSDSTIQSDGEEVVVWWVI